MGVVTELAGPAALVVLDWPEKRNALGPDEANEVAAALRAAAVQPEVRGIVLTGNGAFCAGGDINGMVARADMPPEERRALVYSAYQGLISTLIELPVPTVAAVDGPAVGMGFDIALACDSRFIGPDGWCRQGWARIGLIPGTGGELLLRMRAPGALWRLLDGQPKVGADMAERLGIGEATDGVTARDAALRRVESYAAYSPATISGYVRLNRAELRARLPEHQAECLATPAQAARRPGVPRPGARGPAGALTGVVSGTTSYGRAAGPVTTRRSSMTMYFPLIVHGALLIEPTETESKASLDQFAEMINTLAAKARSGDPARFHAAPRWTPRRRMDETAAARKPVLRWYPEASDRQTE